MFNVDASVSHPLRSVRVLSGSWICLFVAAVITALPFWCWELPVLSPLLVVSGGGLFVYPRLLARRKSPNDSRNLPQGLHSRHPSSQPPARN